MHEKLMMLSDSYALEGSYITWMNRKDAIKYF